MSALWFVALFAAGVTQSPDLAAPLPPTALQKAEACGSLLEIRRVYVDKLSGGEAAVQMRDMIISSLLNARLFAITENEERADAVLRGSSEDSVFTDEHTTSDSINATLHGGSSSSDGYYRSSNSRTTGASIGEHESSHVAERRHEASAAVRIVSRNGDVLWSTTQESLGGKFRGSSADVADKITRRLIEDMNKAKSSQVINNH